MLGWAAGPAGGQAPVALRGERNGPLPPSGWPDKVPPADLIPCGGSGGVSFAGGVNRFSFRLVFPFSGSYFPLLTKKYNKNI